MSDLDQTTITCPDGGQTTVKAKIKCSLCPERLEVRHITVHKLYGPICCMCNLHLSAVKFQDTVQGMLARSRRKR